MSKRIVVVGSKGFIGSSLVSFLNKNEVPCLPISKSEFDLLDSKDCESIRNILLPNDVIVFSSAITPSRSSQDVIDTMLMLQNFMKIVSGLALGNFLLISSDSVYGDLTGTVSEESPVNPNTFHGLAQVAREMILKSSNLHRQVILRLCAVYGPGDTHNSYGPNRFVNQIMNGENIKVFGTGANMRDHIYIEDVVRTIAFCALSDVSGTFNVASGSAYSFKDVAASCKNVFNNQSEIEFVGSEGLIFNKRIDISRILGLSPTLAFTELDSGLNKWRMR